MVLTMNRSGALHRVLSDVTGWTDVGGVIVVDNNSSDGTAEAVASDFPGVSLIRSNENLGATGGRNLGLRSAADSSYQYVFLAEDDTAPSRDALERCLRAISLDPRAAIVGTYGGIFRQGRVRWGQYAPPAESTEINECDFVLLDGCVVRTDAMTEVGGYATTSSSCSKSRRSVDASSSAATSSSVSTSMSTATMPALANRVRRRRGAPITRPGTTCDSASTLDHR